MLHSTAAACSVPGLQQQDLARKGNFLHGRRVTEHPNPAPALLRGSEALKSPSPDQLVQPPALAGDSRVCLLAPRSTHRSSPKGGEGALGRRQPEQEGVQGRKGRLEQLYVRVCCGGRGRGTRYTVPFRLTTELQQACLLAVHEELSHQTGSVGTFLDLLFSV